MQNLCSTLKGNHEQKQFVKVEFSNYQELGTHLFGLLEIIELLSLSETPNAKQILPYISTLTHFAKQTIPFGELELLDKLLIKSSFKSELTEQQFKEVSELKL